MRSRPSSALRLLILAAFLATLALSVAPSHQASFKSIALPQDETRKERHGSASADDEAALRALAQEFYAAYAKKDLDGFLRLWSAKSPELASRQAAMQKLFADHEKIEVKSLTALKATIDSEKAKLRADIEINAVGAKTGKPDSGYGRMIRVLQCVREGGAWKVWREAPLVEDLAHALAAAKTNAERAVLLVEEKEAVTEQLPQELNRQGARLRSQGDYPEALVRFRLAQDVAERIGDKGELALALSNIGAIYFLQGDYTLALEYYQKSLALNEALDDKEGGARALNNIGNVHASQSNYALALEYYQRSLATKDALGDRARIARTLNNIGAVQRLQGNYAEALEYYQKSLATKEALGDKAGVAITLGNIGIVHRLQGDYIRALEYHQKSLAMSEALGDKDEIARLLNLIGNVYGGQGAYAHALLYFEKSLVMSEAIGNKAYIVDALNNIGIIRRLQGDYAQALEYYQKGLALGEALADKDKIARTLNNIGVVHSSRGRYAQALEYYQKGLAIRESIGDKEGIANTLNNIGKIHKEQGRYSQALDFAGRATALALQINDGEALWQSRSTAGSAYLALNQPNQSRRAFEESITAIEALRARVAGAEREQESFFENKIYPYHAMVELLVAQNQTGEALAYAERAKARALLDTLRNGHIDGARALTAAEQDQERGFNNRLVSLNAQISRESLRPQSDGALLNDLKAQLQKARVDYEAFQTALYVAHPELKAQRGEARPLTPEQARDLLPDARSALLEYVVTGERTYLFAMTGGGAGTAAELKVYPLEIKGKELADRAAKFRETLAQGSPGFRRPARELYDLLLKPAAAQLQGKTSLVIVPDASLWELPFQALLAGPNRYLIEDCAIAYAPSLTALREMVRLREGKKGSTSSPTLLAFGNPALGAQTIARARSVLMDGKLDPLPEAERQVNILKQIYGATESKVYIGAEAREERAKAEAGAYRILHLATHGVLNDSSPMYSHLLLTQTEGGANEDGLLEAWEIMKLDLKADLAVLSACETARGRVGAGEGLIGLSWALFVAGCPTTVVSQWKVDSAATTELMLEFHRGLRSQTANATGGPGAARVLREAALKLRRTAAYRHPFYWAGFVVAGMGF